MHIFTPGDQIGPSAFFVCVCRRVAYRTSMNSQSARAPSPKRLNCRSRWGEKICMYIRYVVYCEWGGDRRTCWKCKARWCNWRANIIRCGLKNERSPEIYTDGDSLCPLSAEDHSRTQSQMPTSYGMAKWKI